MKRMIERKRLAWVGLMVLLAGICWIVAMVRPSASKAASTLVEMPAFVFPPVTLSGGQTVEVCGTNMGEGAVRGLIGLVDAADSSKALAEIPFTFDAHKGTCVNLPGVQHGQGNSGDPVNVIALVAFQNSTQWSASGKSFNASLQIRDGNVTK